MLSRVLTHHVEELFHQVIGALKAWASLPYHSQVLPFFFLELIGFAEKEPGGLLNRNRPEQTGRGQRYFLCLSFCSTTPPEWECRRVQGRQVAIDRPARTRCSPWLSALLPVAIRCDIPGSSAGEDRSGRDQADEVAEPVANRSLRHPHLHGNVGRHIPCLCKATMES